MQTLLAFIIVLGVLIFVHELGHFVTAKLAGIAVPRFSIGLGPKVWGITVGETEYVLSALPLGGYVKMAGMGEDEALETIEGGPVDSDEANIPPERRFDSKSIPARFSVISAGVIMNFIFAILVFAGLAYTQGERLPMIGEVSEDSPAETAGLLSGDLVTAVDGQLVHTFNELAIYLSERPGEEVNVRIQRGDRQLELPIRVEPVRQVTVDGDSITIGRIGVRWEDLEGASRPIGLGTAFVSGWRATVTWSEIILDFLGGLAIGDASFRDLGGPITIGQLSGQAARAGITSLMNFMAILSVNLAILNLLPIPILDGGHLVFLGIEAVRGRALSIETRAKASQVGFIFILVLMVWALTSDFLRITGN